MFAIDTNILVYAHNTISIRHLKAKRFLEKIISEEGEKQIGIPVQVCSEFINVCTRKNVGKPLSLTDAIGTIRRYSDYLKIPIIYPKTTQLESFLALLSTTATRKKVFDVYLAATLKDNNIAGLYTVNIKDFQEFDFLSIEDPL